MWRHCLSYLREFRLNWTNLLGAGLGLGFGTAFNHYLMNVFGPVLIADLGWTKAQFALVGSIGLAGMLFTPVAGRITDRIGPRNAAIIGFTAIPLAYLALSFMSGNIYEFYTILALKFMFGILTATMVFTRVVVERFDRARGIAMACLLSCPPAIGAISAPIIGGIIEAEGWRFAYRVMAAVTAGGGLLAVILIGRYMNSDKGLRPPAPQLDWAQLRDFCRNRVFLLLMAGMFLVNFPQPLVSSQMNIMLIENGASMGFATALVSVYALSVVIGRFIGGFALDRVKPHFVAIVSLGLPAIGFVALASSFDARLVLAASMALVGLAQGAETDVAAILTSRRFDMGHYSFVFSLLMTSMGLASSLGSLLLSYTLMDGGTFSIFLYVCAGTTVLGALCFFLTGNAGARHDRMMGELA